MPRKSMATKVRENMHQAITDNKKRPSRAVFFVQTFLVKTIKALSYSQSHGKM